MRRLDKGELEEILQKHKDWLDGKPDGEKADLSYVNLSGANLSDAVLYGADLAGADLTGANLRRANLYGADLTDADLTDAYLDTADLSYANLSSVNLAYAYLKGANLRNADLTYANLIYANLNFADLTNADLNFASLYGVNLYGVKNLFVPLACPEKGSFIGFKKAHHLIIELEIPSDARRSSATGRKCRCDKAKVLSITTVDDEEINLTQIESNFDSNFVYKVGEIVEEPNFNTNRFNECASGIHFFITRQEAINF